MSARNARENSSIIMFLIGLQSLNVYGCTYEHKIVHTHVTAREEDENVQKIEINLIFRTLYRNTLFGYNVAPVI